MKLATRILTASIVLLASASVAGAAPSTWKIDPNHSEVGFSVRHFFSQVHGRFHAFEGSIVFDENDPSAIQVDAKVDAASVDTGNPNRDADLKTDHFFLVEKYPSNRHVPAAREELGLTK